MRQLCGVVWTGRRFLKRWPTLLFDRRSRQAVYGLVMLRRAFEHVLVTAVIEGVLPTPRPYYDGYVDALNILGAKAALIARTL
jgi:hypothetical protein